MQKIDDFAMKAYLASLKKNHPGISRASIYSFIVNPSKLYIALEVSKAGRKLRLIHDFEDIDGLEELLETTIAENILDMLGLYHARSRVSEGDVFKKAHAMLLLDNPKRTFELDDAIIGEVRAWCKGLIADSDGDNRKAWTRLDSINAWESFEMRRETREPYEEKSV